MDRITDKLYKKSISLTKSKDYFKEVWPQMQSISKIAFEFKIEKLMNKVMEFIDDCFDHILEEDKEVLSELNDSTDGRLFTLMVDKCSEFRKKLNEQNIKINDKVNKSKSDFIYFEL